MGGGEGGWGVKKEKEGVDVILLSLMSAIISCVSNTMTLLSLIGEGGKFRGGKEIQWGGGNPGVPPFPPVLIPVWSGCVRTVLWKFKMNFFIHEF